MRFRQALVRAVVAAAVAAPLVGGAVFDGTAALAATTVISEPPALCQPGFFSATGTVPCTPAPVGTFVDTPGATAPTTCPVGTTTDAVGSVACHAIAKQNQTITFAGPATGLVGDSYTPTATASSGLQVTFGLASTSTGCTLTAGTVAYTAPGTCIVTADQAGNSAYEPAAAVSVTTNVTAPPPPQDRTPPTVTFTPNGATYGLFSPVSIRCAATDEPGGSGLSDDPCAAANARLAASTPAWNFGPGDTTTTVRAVDGAGNATTASVTFTVKASASDLCTLTTQLVRSSTRYTGSGPVARVVVDVTTQSACAALKAITPTTSASTKKALVAAYSTIVRGLGGTGYLAPAQVTQLTGFAGTV